MSRPRSQPIPRGMAKLDENALCKRGHRLTIENTVFKTSHGRVHRRCRKCHNDYHRELGRISRWEARVKRRLTAAIELIEDVTQDPRGHAREVVAAAILFGTQARRTWRRRVT